MSHKTNFGICSLGIFLAFTIPAISFGSIAPAGVFSFDNLIPAMTSAPGVNVFDITNLTGDPDSGGYALPPDFPIFASLVFQNATLTLDTGSSTLTIPLGDIGPGPLADTSPVQFPDIMSFVSATFTATLSQTVLPLWDSSTFVANSPTVTVELLPSSGPFLQAGVDSAVIVLDNSVPEPATPFFVFVGIAVLICMKTRSCVRDV